MKSSRIVTPVLHILLLVFTLTIFAFVAIYLYPQNEILRFFFAGTSIHSKLFPPKELMMFLEGTIAPNATTTLGNIEIGFIIEPYPAIIDKDTTLKWTIIDQRTGEIAALDPVMHNIPVHIYGVHHSLAGELLHLHPPEAARFGSKERRDTAKFELPGTWYLVHQFTKDGILYQLTSIIEVYGKASTPPTPTPALTRKTTVREHRVEFIASPQTIRAGILTDIGFQFSIVSPDGKSTLNDHRLTSGHNLLFVHERESYIWNWHGDNTVANVAKFAGIPMKRMPDSRYPFTHQIIFPHAGRWRIQLETLGEPAIFFIEVQP